MILLDTNIILRFILNNDPILSPKAKTIFEKTSHDKDKIYISLLAISEIIFTLERSYKLPRLEIVSKLLQIISPTNFIVEKRKLIEQALAYYVDENVSFVDAYHVVFMEQRNLKQIYSFDSDFDKFPQIERLKG